MTVDFLKTGHEPCSRPGGIVFVDWGIRLGRRTILTQISLSITGPGVTVLMGPAGTGKSTLLKTLAGLHSAHGSSSGQILLDGQPLPLAAGVPPALAQQHPRELDFSVLDTLIAAQRGNGMSPAQMRQRALDTLHQRGQSALIEHQQQRLFDLPRELMRCALIIRAMLTGSPILLIDEPTSGLDASQSQPVLQLIQSLAATHTCIVVLHNQQQARQIADHLILLAGGRVQVAADADTFFNNAQFHPVLAQFLRTGSCHVPSPDARPEELDSDLLACETPADSSPPAPLPALEAQATAPPSDPTYLRLRCAWPPAT